MASFTFRRRYAVARALALVAAVALSAAACDHNPSLSWEGPPAEPRNLILFIGDGMGQGQIMAGESYLGRAPNFVAFPIHTRLATAAADSAVTDSAAAATALATGHKVNNGVIAVALPGDGSPLATMLESVAAGGRWTGLATSSFVTDATPAAFAAHQASRNSYAAIAADIFGAAKPNLVLGGGGDAAAAATANRTLAAASGYAVVSDLAGLNAAAVPDPAAPVAFHLAGLFGNGILPYENAAVGPHAAGLPDLADLTRESLRRLEAAPNGFFLMVEGGLIDKAAHANNAALMVGEVAALDRAVAVAVAWAADRTDTLIIVTADHETGGINYVGYQPVGVAGVVPGISWTTTGHTSSPVDLYAKGSGAERLAGLIDNSQLRAALYP
jgi:alkaline phosphatase